MKKEMNLVQYALALVGLAVSVYVVGYAFKKGSQAGAVEK
jgi:hypothetical protein|tara:strand:+ start:4209 stop:4328 length:120 start_codon:yes stop_codon:yes gene_type:complete